MKRKAFNYAFQQKAEELYQIYLYDEISELGSFNWNTWKFEDSETSAKHFRELLDEIPENATIELFINSCGGEVDQGTAIFNMLQMHKGQVIGYVTGVAHSIAFTIFQGCDRRVMGEGTSAIIHNIWGSCCGTAADMRNYANMLDAMMDSCIDMYMARVKNLTEQQLREMMEAETCLSPAKALEYGLCDEVGMPKEKADIKSGTTPPEDEEKQSLKEKIMQQEMELQQFKKDRQLMEFAQNIKNRIERENIGNKGTGFGAFLV